ncbi:MAG TPA: hypothetical protein VFZ44_07665 [Pyrinomonadaceae bacterium]
MRVENFRRRAFILAAALFTLLSATSQVCAQTVVSRTRIGGYAEDIAYASGGALKDNIILTDGYEIFAVPVAKKERAKEPMTRLFDIKGLGIDVNPRGITYIESEDLFVVNDVAQRSTLFLFDAQGQPRGTRKITYLGGYAPQHLEGMGYIPAGSAVYPDHLMQVALDTLNGPSRIEILTRAGQVVKEVTPNWPVGSETVFMGDVAFLPPNRLLVTFYDNSIWTVDFDGNVVAGPQVYPGPTGFEGLVRLGDGRFVATGFPQSLLYFDAALNRQPENDRHDIIGLNVNVPIGVAWNSDTNRHLIVHSVNAISDSPAGFVASVSPALDAATPFADMTAAGLTFPRRATYLPAEHLLGVVHLNGPRAIVLFNPDGTINSQVDLSPATIGSNLGGATGVEYLPATNEFAVTFNGNPTPDPAAERRRIRVVSRTGALVRTIDLTCTGTQGIGGIAYFEEAGSGRLLVLASAGRVLVTDLNGNLLREFNLRVRLGMMTASDLSAITTGPQAGAFAAVDSTGGEIVVFRLD